MQLQKVRTRGVLSQGEFNTKVALLQEALWHKVKAVELHEGAETLQQLITVLAVHTDISADGNGQVTDPLKQIKKTQDEAKMAVFIWINNINFKLSKSNAVWMSQSRGECNMILHVISICLYH